MRSELDELIVDKIFKGKAPECFHPSSDVKDDYVVLQEVRNCFYIKGRDRFKEELHKIFASRYRKPSVLEKKQRKEITYVSNYQPGDYSLAALRAMGEKV